MNIPLTLEENIRLDAIAELQVVAPERDLLEFNEKYAVVKIGGKTRVMSMEQSPAGLGSVPVYSSFGDFAAFNNKRRKIVTDTTGKQRKVGIGTWWLDNEGRRQYDGVVYAPNEDTPGKFNLWAGFAVEPKPGDCSLFLDHIHQGIANDVEVHSSWLLGWMAHAVQNPGQAGEVAVVLRGKEGTGKGVFAKQFGRLFGSHCKHILNPRHLTGNFNAHLQQCSVLISDEATFAADRSHESILKGLITEDTLLIEPKGVDSFAVRNCIHLIMLSNSDWVVPAGADARRYFVLDVSDARMQDHAYFKAIVDQMASGGDAALLDMLLKMDLSDFDLRQVPKTAALADQKMRSRRGIDRLVEQIAHDGILPSADLGHAYISITTGEEHGEGFYYRARQLVPDLKYENSTTIVTTLCQHWGCIRWKSGLRRGIRFPPLHELRDLFDRRHGAQSWPDDIKDWEHGQ